MVDPISVAEVMAYTSAGLGAFMASMDKNPKAASAAIVVGVIWPVVIIITLSHKIFLWTLK